jgi:membrane protease YdiL (CAAX protease family)
VLRYRSLVPAFLLHAANNFLSEAGSVLIPS